MRSALSVLLVMALVLPVIPCISSVVADGARGPPASGDWVVNARELYANQDIHLKGNLTVNGSGFLELSHVNLYLDCNLNGQYGIRVRNGCGLALTNGTNVTRGLGYNYSFSVINGSRLWVNSSSVTYFAPGLYVNQSLADLSSAGLSNSPGGLILNWSSIFLNNSRISSSGLDISFNSSYADLVNSTFNAANVSFNDDLSQLNISWPLMVRTLFLDGAPAAGANVTILDNGSVQRLKQPSDPQGIVSAALRQYQRTRPATLSYSPYNVTAEWAGMARNSTRVALDGPKDVTLALDRSAPAVAFTSPPPGHLNSSTVQFAGTASDQEAVSIVELSSDNGVTWTNASATAAGWSTWNCTLTLLDGSYSIIARATDSSGWQNQTSLSIIIDTLAPIIDILTPLPGSVTNAASVIVSGRTEPNANVTVNHAPAAASNGYFNASVPLRVGWNAIEVNAHDPAGNSASTVVDVLRDVAPPNLTVLSPKNDFLTNQSVLQIVGQSDPDASVYVGTDPAPVTVHPDGAFVASANLIPGSNIVEVRARDRAGNEAVVTLKGVLDSLPPFLNAWAGATLTNLSQTLVSGETEPASSVTVAGTPVEVTPFGTFSTYVGLAPGLNRVSIAAGDAAGNHNYAVVEVYRDVVPPQITIGTPVEHAVLNESNINVSGTADDANGIAGVEVGVDDRNYTFCNGTTSWKGHIHLPEGNHTIAVVAYDRAGNLAKSVRNVTYVSEMADRTPPSLIIIYPLSPEVSQRSITLRCKASDPSGVSLVALSTDGAFTWRTVTLNAAKGEYQMDLTLRTGINRILVRASDPLGNNATKTLDITYVPPPNKSNTDYTAFLVPMIAAVAIAVVAILVYLRWKRWTNLPEPGLGEDEALLAFPGKGLK